MKMGDNIFVLSLGGSMIIPGEINLKYLLGLKKILKKIGGRFVVVCGGGSVARKYIHALRDAGKSQRLQSLAGIAVTRLNARFMTYLFGKEANEGIPMNMKHVRSLLKRNKVVFCGALRYALGETSDATAAKLAHYLKAEFINITDVSGLYDKNPKEHRNARLIPEISWEAFLKKANAIKFHAGQHFILDQKAAFIIKKNRISTYIIGSDLKNLEKFLGGGRFAGTKIFG